jgi:endonuclease G, mitochondrial
MDVLEQAQAAAARYRETEEQRETVARRLDVEGHKVFDTDEQIEMRASRLVESGLVPVSALLTAVRSEPSTAKVVLERIIGEHNDLQPVTFLSRGAEVARTIGRISLQRGGRLVPFGTGFLVAPRLLLTNDHVLPDVHLAAESVIEFDCDPGTPDSEFVLVATDPDRLLLSDAHLDYSLVALRDLPDGRAPGEEFGWNALIGRQGKIVTGEPVNVIGHPMGRTKEVAVRNNRLTYQLEHFLHYETDTEPGNSGSPVYNDTWEVVALHHAGVPGTDGEGNVLKQDGQPWHRSDGDQAIHWVANEGTRVSVLLAHLAGLDLPAEQRQLLATLSEPSPFTAPMGRAAVVAAGPSGPETAARDVWRSRVEGGRAAPSAASRQRTGVRAAGAPYGGEVQLVFVHGRSQQGRDPAQLRNAWTAGLAKGLVSAGLPAIDAADVWFPYYGDTLVDALPTRESALAPASDAEPVEALAPASPDARWLYEALIEEAATAAGMPVELGRDDGGEPEVAESRLLGGAVSRLQRQATWLANRSGLDDLVIARAFRDVAAYLDATETRDRVLDQVLSTVPQRGPVVLVCHSLGTVVGMDLLTRLPDEVEVRVLVTAGSPLGMDTVYQRLLVGGPHLPERVGRWLNAWCSADAVAIGCPLAARWGRRVVEVSTDNPKDRAHDIEEYLADERVARTIGATLRSRR